MYSIIHNQQLCQETDLYTLNLLSNSYYCNFINILYQNITCNNAMREEDHIDIIRIGADNKTQSRQQTTKKDSHRASYFIGRNTC